MKAEKHAAADKQAGMDIRTLQTGLARVAQERAGDPLHAPKNLALALAADAGILLSLFRGLTEQQNLQDDLAREAAADALTSIVVNVAQLANHIGMDASAALRARIKGRPAPPLAPLPAAEVAKEPTSTPAPVTPAMGPVAPALATEAEPKASAAAPVTEASREPTPAPDDAVQPARPPVPKTPETRKSGPAVIAVKVDAPAAKAPSESVPVAVEVVVLDEDPEPADPPPAPAATPAPAPAAASAPAAAVAPAAPVAATAAESAAAARAAPPAPAPHEGIDPERVLEMAKALGKQLGSSTRDDPVLRDLRDELETLRRSLYASSTKKAWIAGSLRTLRDHLHDALAHAFAEEVRAEQFIRDIDALLDS